MLTCTLMKFVHCLFLTEKHPFNGVTKKSKKRIQTMIPFNP